MIIHDVQQGSQEWLDLRGKFFTASEAQAMMGASKYQTRAGLLREKATGHKEDVSAAKQQIFNKGHESEAQARPIIEAALGEDLYPVTCSTYEYSIPLLASLDGMDMVGTTIFEHKLWNDDLAAAVESGEIPESHYWQLEHQLLVSGADKVIFVVSDGTEEKMANIVYMSTEERRSSLIAGWTQFAKELAEYEHVEHKPEAVAQEQEAMPALLIDIEGSVKGSNLATYADAVESRIKAINTDLQTDQDFADAEAMVKMLGAGEKEVAEAKKRALTQTSSIDELFRTVDRLSESMRTKRLELNKLVKQRKEAIRWEIISEAKDNLAKHIAEVSIGLDSRTQIPAVTADFASAIKGKRTIQSLRDAAHQELTDAKIKVGEYATTISTNMQAFPDLAGNYAHLFHDLHTLANKESDDFSAVVRARVNEAREAEQARAEAERERIRAEEQRKAEDQARKQQLTEQVSAPAEATQRRAPAQNKPRVNIQTIENKFEAMLSEDRDGFNIYLGTRKVGYLESFAVGDNSAVLIEIKRETSAA